MIDHSRFAEEVRLRYLMLLQALTGILATALDSQDPDRGIVRTAMIIDANRATAQFVERFSTDARSIVDTMIKMAIHDSGMVKSPKLTDYHMNELRENAEAVLDELVTNIQSVCDRNVATVVNELRQVKLQASLLQSTGMSKFGALMKSRMGRVGELKFTTPDVLGRKWRSSDYVVSMISKNLVQLYVESFLYCAAVDGDTKAKVVYSDAGHANNGMVFNITGSEGASFDNIRDTIWHPNSTAGVERVHA